jgi:hypothetical protein
MYIVWFQSLNVLNLNVFLWSFENVTPTHTMLILKVRFYLLIFFSSNCFYTQINSSNISWSKTSSFICQLSISEFVTMMTSKWAVYHVLCAAFFLTTICLICKWRTIATTIPRVWWASASEQYHQKTSSTVADVSTNNPQYVCYGLFKIKN